jgi:hypothetical protein
VTRDLLLIALGLLLAALGVEVAVIVTLTRLLRQLRNK